MKGQIQSDPYRFVPSCLIAAISHFNKRLRWLCCFCVAGFAFNGFSASLTTIFTLPDSAYGENINGGLLIVSNTIYATTKSGGAGYGTVFKVNTDGSGFMLLHTFTGFPDDGAYPNPALALNGDWLYGTTSAGGASDVFFTGAGDGTVFAVNVNSPASYNMVHSFGNAGLHDGIQPNGDIFLDGDVIYGTTRLGGSSDTDMDPGQGTVYALNVVQDAEANYQILHAFGELNNAPLSGDGMHPGGGMAEVAGWLYGFAAQTEVGSEPTTLQMFAVNSGGELSGYEPNLYSFQNVGTGPLPVNPFSLVFYFPNYTFYGNFGAASLSFTQNGPYSVTSIWTFNPQEAPIDMLYFGLDAPPGSLFGVNPSGNIFEISTDGRNCVTFPEQVSGVLTGTVVHDSLFLSNGEGLPCYAPSGNSILAFTTIPLLHMEPIYVSVNGVRGLVGVKLVWTDPPGIVLQSTTNLSGPWTNIVGAASPYTNLFAQNETQRYFRLMLSATNLAAASPYVATLPPPYISTGNAFMYGQVIPNGADATAWFQYGDTTNYTNMSPTFLVSATNSLFISNLWSGLNNGSSYHYQLVASNVAGISMGGDVFFSDAPSITTVAGTFLGSSNYLLAGLIDPNGFGWDCEASFQYGTNTSYGQTTDSIFVSGTNVSPVLVTNVITGLLPGTLYHFEMLATFTETNPVEYFDTSGADSTFMTQPNAP